MSKRKRPPRALGRPRKDEAHKAKSVTLTLWPDELAALELRIAAVQRASAGQVSRSDLVRVALALLERLSDAEIIRLLIALRAARRDES